MVVSETIWARREEFALVAATILYGTGNIIASAISRDQTLVSVGLTVAAKWFFDHGRHTQALAAYRIARSWDALWLGDEHPIMESHYTNLAVVARLLGHRSLAVQYTERLADITFPSATNFSLSSMASDLIGLVREHVVPRAAKWQASVRSTLGLGKYSQVPLVRSRL